MNAGDGGNKIFFVSKFVALEVGDDDVDFHGGGFEGLKVL
jgi:hypothetical protein